MNKRKRRDSDTKISKKARTLLSESKAASKVEEKRKLIVILEEACLETVSAKNGGYELLNCDDHQGIMKKHNRDWSMARPDITHQCLLILFDSPLNKAGLLQVYIHTKKNVLIEINPQTRIPRTFKRFCGLMVQLLHEYKISSVQEEGHKTLLSVIKNPITDHLPVGCKKIGAELGAPLVDVCDFVKEMNPEEPVVFVVGAMSKGKINADYVDQQIGISEYPLSGAVVCSRICQAFERQWKIL
eukprot:TRINITY_DN3036_c0_g1_i1.p1 TRINITY_DN3036_c0_g1~~TRINITY_DN3036_c0_g1_i1.p1  ORF type:complete len:257 (+),score=36.04 TRINITY_DN3036_c0_g1_i1:43-771(+)